MASTIQLQRTNTYASSFVRYAPLTMSADDPTFLNADWVRQFILSAPFAWRWNRAVATFTCVAGKTDYVEALSDFGWIETAVSVNKADGYSSVQLEVALDLEVENRANLPQKISAQMDDGAGNITFRVLPAPDVPYVVTVTYQKASPVFANLTDTWSPLPDFLSYVYTQGFLAKTYEYLGDSRFQPAMSLFLQLIVSANQGLTDTQRTIFLTDRMNTAREQLAVQNGRG